VKTDTDLVDETEEWFVRIGLPHFIDDFSASEDVWTRVVGLLSTIFFAEVFLTFGGALSGWAQAGAFVTGVALIVGAIATLNRFRGRSPFARPDDIGWGELAVFVLVPPVLALLGGHRDAFGFLWVVGFNLAALLVVYVVVAWGLFPMARWGLGVMVQHLSQVLQLLGRILPLMLLFSAFLFLNAEIWQVANDFSWLLFGIVLAALVVIGTVFLAGSMAGAINELRWFSSWDEVDAELDDTPLEGFDPLVFDGRPERVPLDRPARFNLALRLLVGLGAQALVVTLAIFGFYVLFGLLTVREDTVLQWTTLGRVDPVRVGSFDLAGNRILLTELHLMVAGVVAAFSGLQFAVSLVTDSDYRRQYVEQGNAEVREAIAVRATYLRLVERLEGSKGSETT